MSNDPFLRAISEDSTALIVPSEGTIVLAHRSLERCEDSELETLLSKLADIRREFVSVLAAFLTEHGLLLNSDPFRNANYVDALRRLGSNELEEDDS